MVVSPSALTAFSAMASFSNSTKANVFNSLLKIRMSRIWKIKNDNCTTYSSSPVRTHLSVSLEYVPEVVLGGVLIQAAQVDLGVDVPLAHAGVHGQRHGHSPRPRPRTPRRESPTCPLFSCKVDLCCLCPRRTKRFGGRSAATSLQKSMFIF